MSIFSSQHYNALAKEIRYLFAIAVDTDKPPTKFGKPYIADTASELAIEMQGRFSAIETLINLALNLCLRFEDDDPDFDPRAFLNACSPDQKTYPLATLWLPLEKANDAQTLH